MKSVSVIVPVYNNEETIEPLFRRLVSTLDTCTPGYEIIFVNDGSSDRSWDRICAMSNESQHVVGIRLSRNFGQHPAISAGLERAAGSLVVLMDADLQDRPEELPKLLARFDEDENIDIVYSTFGAHDGEKSRATSRVFHRVFAKITGLDLPDNLGTYRVFTSRVRDALLQYPERRAVYGPLMAQMGFEHVYVEVDRDRAVGRKTSYSLKKRLSLAVSALISYSSFLHQLVSWTGALMATMSGAYLLVILLQYAVGGRGLSSGITLLLAVVLLTSGVLLTTVGVLTAYVFRVFHETLQRPRFHVARSVGNGLKSSL